MNTVVLIDIGKSTAGHSQRRSLGLPTGQPRCHRQRCMSGPPICHKPPTSVTISRAQSERRSTSSSGGEVEVPG
jgi:hypothetical protein